MRTAKDTIGKLITDEKRPLDDVEGDYIGVKSSCVLRLRSVEKLRSFILFRRIRVRIYNATLFAYDQIRDFALAIWPPPTC